MVNTFRKLLIRIGKCLPFVICFLVCIHYAESLFAIVSRDFCEYGDAIILNTRVSFCIAKYMDYNIQMLLVLGIISIAIETCIYNKLACLYLGVNLLQKSYFECELDEWTIVFICLANLLIAGYITYKGIKILLR